MTPEVLRLECLKLAHRHDQPPAVVTARANDYVTWITGQAASADPAGQGVSKAAEKPTRKRGPAAVPERPGE